MKISLLLKIFNNLGFPQILQKISVLVKIFEKSRFLEN